jgi:hypothetical protein
VSGPVLTMEQLDALVEAGWGEHPRSEIPPLVLQAAQQGKSVPKCTKHYAIKRRTRSEILADKFEASRRRQAQKEIAQ